VGRVDIGKAVLERLLDTSRIRTGTGYINRNANDN
jgi:hypothetical protein